MSHAYGFRSHYHFGKGWGGGGIFGSFSIPEFMVASTDVMPSSRWQLSSELGEAFLSLQFALASELLARVPRAAGRIPFSCTPLPPEIKRQYLRRKWCDNNTLFK